MCDGGRRLYGRHAHGRKPAVEPGLHRHARLRENGPGDRRQRRPRGDAHRLAGMVFEKGVQIVMVVCRKRETGRRPHIAKTSTPRPSSPSHRFGHLRRRDSANWPNSADLPDGAYADIVLPLAQPAYTYAVPDGLDVAAGQAVAVQFGARRIYTGIVWRIHDRRPDFPRIKTVSRVLYDRPLLAARQRALWEWMADYYLCTLGEVMRFALPRRSNRRATANRSSPTRSTAPAPSFTRRSTPRCTTRSGSTTSGAALTAGAAPVRRAPRHRFGRGGDRISTGEVPRRLLGPTTRRWQACRRKTSSAHPPRTARRTRLRRLPLPS